MKIRNVMLMTSLLALCTITACSSQPKPKPKTEAKPLEIHTNLKNVDATFYQNKSTNYAIQFLAVSNEKLEEKDISFVSDNTMPINFEMSEKEDMKSEYYDCLVSKKLDFKALAKGYTSKDEQEVAKAKKKLEAYRSEYEDKELGMKDTFVYGFTLNFAITSIPFEETSVVKEITMKVKNQTFPLQVGQIQFVKDDGKEDDNCIEQVATLGRVGKKVIPDAHKAYQEDIDEWQFKVHEDCELQSIKSLQDGFTIPSVEVRIKKANGIQDTKTYHTTKLNLNLHKGDELTINPVFKGKKSNQIIYQQTYNYQMQVKHKNQTETKVIESGILATMDTAYKILHEQELEKEYQNYYNQFAQVIMR